jgi:DNA-binding transcriptional regulator of glucitol operon
MKLLAVAAVLAAALCLLLGVWMGRDSTRADRELRDQGYVEQHGWFV